MARKSSKTKLDKKPAGPKPKFVMAEPNDDAAAFGWTLGKLRYLSEEKINGEQWPGRGVFDVPYDYATRQVYGHIIEFVNPAFLQIQLDSSPDVRAAAEKARDAGYTQEAIAKLRKTIVKVFNEQVLPNIAAQFNKAAGMVAEFYCARLAHIELFGNED
jgi:hypothetical protein